MTHKLWICWNKKYWIIGSFFLLPAGQPAWPASAETRGGPSPLLLSSGCYQSWMGLHPATSPSPACATEGKGIKRRFNAFFVDAQLLLIVSVVGSHCAYGMD